MNFAEVKDILLDEDYIDNIVSRNEVQYAGKEYSLVVHCDLILRERNVPVVLCVPYDWEIKLFDFYVRDYKSFPFIPHVENQGKICLYDLEGVLIDTQFDGLLRQCFRQAADVLSTGLSGDNRNDFIAEFDAYWQKNPDCGTVRFAVPEEKKSTRIYYEYKMRNSTDKVLFANAEVKGSGVLRDWDIKGTMHRGVYIYVETKEYVYPPDPRQIDLNTYINGLLNIIELSELEGLFKRDDKPFLIFEIRQPNGISTFLSIYTKQGHLTESKGHYKFENDSILFPLQVVRIDKSYLMNRVESGINPLRNLNVLIVGAGSIGGYLASFLAKTGCEHMTIVDYQLFLEENIYRHVLDKSSVGHYKAEALAKKIHGEVPSVFISVREDHIENALREGSLDFTDYDVIFSVTGNHNINRWINKTVVNSGVPIPVIYAWNEPLDVGFHLAIVRVDREGTFEDLFRRDEITGQLYDVTSYCAKNQKVTRNMAGCGGSYIPYGSEVSIMSATAAIDMLKRYVTGRIGNNEVVSYKGDGLYFAKAGFVTSKIFDEQNELVNRRNISELL